MPCVWPTNGLVVSHLVGGWVGVAKSLGASCTLIPRKKDTPFLLERIYFMRPKRSVVFAKDSIAVPLNCVAEAGAS